ncbi:MAG: nucleoside recognition domain-containing protein [Bacteroidota bacterium]|nr:nucleoside recognition domain-containing protein [Bacteroidota bacterium]
MALSRFWLAIFIFSILFIFFDLMMDKHYSLDHMINGKKDDKILIAEKYQSEISTFIWDSLQKSEDKTFIAKNLETQIDTIYQANLQTIKVYYGTQKSDGLLPTCKSSIFDIILPLMAYLAFFCGILQLLIDSGATEKLAKFSSPLFVKIFPSLPKNHESISYMTLNFAANFLGLDSAATPFGLKAMQSLQEINPDKDKASDAQIMFMCLHAAGLTLIPTSIIGYRAAQNAANPADVMLPCIITSFIGTLAALIIVGIKQKINFKSRLLLLSIFSVIGGIIGLLLYINQMGLIAKNHFTGNLSTIILFLIILFTLIYAFSKEKLFLLKNTNVFNSFVTGANSGVQTGVTIFPYVLGMLAAISIFRNSGLFEMISNGISHLFMYFGVGKHITDSLPVALLRPFSSGGSRGFMIDAMKSFGADSFTGRLSCIFQCSAETTFYVIAVYFGAVKIKNTRYTLGIMLLVDLICVVAAIGIASLFF